MVKATKDFSYNYTHNIRVEGSLIKKKKSGKITLDELALMIQGIDKKVGNLENRFDSLENRINNLVKANKLVE